MFLAHRDLIAQVELRHDLPCQKLQREALPLRDAVGAGLGIQHAEGADRQAIGRFEQRPGIKRRRGSPATSGLWTNRSSSSVSGTMNTTGCRMACRHSDASSGSVSVPTPISALNHWRSAATKFTTAMGFEDIGDQPNHIIERGVAARVQNRVAVERGKAGVFHSVPGPAPDHWVVSLGIRA